MATARFAFAPIWLHAWQQWLMGLWFWSFCCNYKSVDSPRRQRKDNFDMVSKIRSSLEIIQKSILLVQILTFLLVTVVLAEIRGFKLATGTAWFLPVLAGVDRSRFIAGSIALEGCLAGLRSSTQWIGNGYIGDTRAFFGGTNYELWGFSSPMPSLLLNSVTTFL